jgi:hypothetical protein
VPYNIFNICTAHSHREVDMETKLTVRIDGRLVARAKKRARASGRSLSRLVADLLSSLEAADGPAAIEPTPRTTALRGALAGLGPGGAGESGGGRP